MNMQEIDARITEINASIVHVSAQLNILQGHLKEAIFWKEKLEKSQDEEKSDVKIDSENPK